jgi:hypothetical protein
MLQAAKVNASERIDELKAKGGGYGKRAEAKQVRR